MQTGDPLLPPNADAAGALEVVPVHHDVHQQIDVNDDPLHRSQTDQLGVAEQGGGTVVVGVQESQGLLLEEEEHGIDELDVFGQVVELPVSLGSSVARRPT